MAKANTAKYLKSESGEWQILVVFGSPRHAPAPGEGLGTVHIAELRASSLPGGREETRLRLTSRVFKRDGDLMAFAERD